MYKLTILGVSHIRPTLPEVLEELSSLDIKKETTIFIEPKRNVLLNKEKFVHESIGAFFMDVLKKATQKTKKIIPLNSNIMPSHNTNDLMCKYSRQLAEEEYMAEIIRTFSGSNNIVIIGDIHAPRLFRLLYDDFDISYKKLAPTTPDDIIAHSWRMAIEGTTPYYIKINWLIEINKKICSRLGISQKLHPQRHSWNERKTYLKYIKTANEEISKLKTSRYISKISSEDHEMIKDEKNETLYQLSSSPLEEHLPITETKMPQLSIQNI